MLFNASTTPCNLQCSTIVSNLFCCDEIFLPGLFFKNIYAFPREMSTPKSSAALQGCACDAGHPALPSPLLLLLPPSPPLLPLPMLLLLPAALNLLLLLLPKPLQRTGAH